MNSHSEDEEFVTFVLGEHAGEFTWHTSIGFNGLLTTLPQAFRYEVKSFCCADSMVVIDDGGMNISGEGEKRLICKYCFKWEKALSSVFVAQRETYGYVSQRKDYMKRLEWWTEPTFTCLSDPLNAMLMQQIFLEKIESLILLHEQAWESFCPESEADYEVFWEDQNLMLEICEQLSGRLDDFIPAVSKQ